jgi:cyclic-di-GMP-binding protein
MYNTPSSQIVKEGTMASFDIVNRPDLQEIDNAVNNTRKELATRFDFRNVKTEIAMDRAEGAIKIVTADEMKMKDVKDILLTHCIRRKVDPKSFEFKEIEPASQGRVRMDVAIVQGLPKETAQKIVKLIKAEKLKVQVAIQDDQVRVTGSKIDDLQQVIRMLDAQELPQALQYVNMKR